ncbi:MAG TPA: phenylacetate--CoA ligase family protein, partial [Bacteroidia bacterium]|nr:phenylacetate--CoA ligase family protein [Bacteroidia bacterium]
MTLLGNIEFQTTEEIRSMQQQRLADLLKYVSAHSNYYQNLFQQYHINPDKISLDNLHELPFTTKDNLACSNDDFLCVDKNQIADFVTTSGTMSDPVTFYLTS